MVLALLSIIIGEIALIKLLKTRDRGKGVSNPISFILDGWGFVFSLGVDYADIEVDIDIILSRRVHLAELAHLSLLGTDPRLSVVLSVVDVKRLELPQRKWLLFVQGAPEVLLGLANLTPID